MSAEPESMPFQLERVVVNPAVPPVPIQHFVLTRVGEEVLLEGGHLDFVQLRVAIEAVKAGNVPEALQLLVYHRALISIETLRRLHSSIEQILGEEVRDDSLSR